MIFQQWVMQRCGGRPSEAIRRIEAANDGQPIGASRVYRAMRKPQRFPVRFAQLVVTATDGECTLVELMDLDVIAASFEYDSPDLRRRGMEYQVLKLDRRRATACRQLERMQAVIAELDAELTEYRAKLAELGTHDADAPPLTAA